MDILIVWRVPKDILKYENIQVKRWNIIFDVSLQLVF